MWKYGKEAFTTDYASACIVPALLWIPCGLGGQYSPHPGVWGLGGFQFCKHCVCFSPSCLSRIHITKGGRNFVYLPASAQGLQRTGDMLLSVCTSSLWGSGSSNPLSFLSWTNCLNKLVCVMISCVSSDRGAPRATEPSQPRVPGAGAPTAPWFPCITPAPPPAPPLPSAQKGLFLQQMHRCPGADPLLEQILFFKAKHTGCWSPGWILEEVLPPYTLPSVPRGRLCTYLPSFPVPGALLPNKAACHNASES